MSKMKYLLSENDPIASKICESGKSIYDSLGPDDQSLWLPNLNLEKLLNETLCGLSLHKLPLRTRSKVVKEAVCEALGYPVPTSFKKTQPRFPGQNFDTYIQKSNNLQIWNEELDASRRYVLIKISADDVIQRVKVVDGATLAKLDRTGTLTQKYQAQLSLGTQLAEAASVSDTPIVESILGDQKPPAQLSGTPIDAPSHSEFIPIRELFERLRRLIGITFPDAGHDQERNRGEALHRRICQAIGYTTYLDDGAFPDITAQILEVKLQTSPTIDLGLVTPDSTDELDLPPILGSRLRHCDVRYAIFYGKTDGSTVTLSNLILVTGEDFFKRFKRFEGKILNKKLQIPLPANFFNTNPECGGNKLV
jgi:hypothetical protein